MQQEALIEYVIEALELDVGTVNEKTTLTKAKLLVKDTDGEITHDNFCYSSVMGILFYLSGYSQPDILYVINCTACCMIYPKHSHELALKRIGRNLNATCSKELILNSSFNPISKMIFADVYQCSKTNDTACVNSKTCYVITVADYYVLWQLKLQSETALSTMEAEAISLANITKNCYQ